MSALLDNGDADQTTPTTQAVVTLAVTVHEHGAERRYRTFTVTSDGDIGGHRPARQLLTAVQSDAKNWVDSLFVDAQRQRHVIAPPRLSRWQRLVYTLAGVPAPAERVITDRTRFRPKSGIEMIGDGRHAHTVTVRCVVACPVLNDQVTQDGTTHGSVAALADGVIDAVCLEMGSRILNAGNP